MKIISDWLDKFKIIRERFKRYWAVLAWLISDLWKFGRHRLLIVVGASFFSKTLISSVFVLLFFYLKALERGTASWLKYFPEGMAISDLFWPVAIAGSVLFICSSLVDFAVIRQILDLSNRHGVDISRRCLSVFFPILPNLKGMGSPPFPNDTVWISTNGTNILMRATRTLLRSVLPFFNFLYTTILLVLIDPFVVFTVVLIAIPGFCAIYLINSQILQNEYDIPEFSSKRRKIAYAQVREMANQSYSIDEQLISDWENKSFPFLEAARLRAGRVLHKQRSRTLTNLIVGVALLVVMGQLGYEALVGDRGWTVVITFIALLKVAGNSLGGIFSTFAFVSRLYPILRRFPLYLRHPGFLPPGNNLKTTEIKNSLGAGDLGKVQILPGKIYHIFTHIPLSPLNLWFFVNCLSNNKILRAGDLIDRTIFFNTKSAFTEYVHGNKKGMEPLVLLNAKLWCEISDKVVNKFPGSTLVICHKNVPDEPDHKECSKGIWIIPTIYNQTGLCTSDWFYKHLDEINVILSRKNKMGETQAEEDDEEDDED